MAEELEPILTPEALDGFEGINLPGDTDKLLKMIEDAEAMASLAAPCILLPEFRADAQRMGQVRAVLRSAVVRWNEAGSGAATNLASGPFQATLDTRQTRRTMFWPSELTQLRDICSAFNGKTKERAFSIDTAPVRITGHHADICSVHFGAACSCGSDLNNGEGPIFGGGS